MRFTTTWIEKLRPAKARRDYTETSRPGFMLRVWPVTGVKTFVYRYQSNGARRILTLGQFPATSLAEAHERFEEARKHLDAGRDPIIVFNAKRAAETNAGTVKELIAEWFERYANRERKRPDDARKLLDNNLPAAFLKRKAKDVTRRDVITLLDSITDRTATVANDVASLLKQIFAFGVEREFGGLSASPIVALKPPGGEEPPRTRALSDAELRAVWHTLPKCEMSERVALALKLLMVTGQRRGETAAMRWADIEGDTWTIPAAFSKNGKAHEVPLSPLAQSLLARLKVLAEDSPLVFPTAHSVKKSGKSMTERAITRAIAENRDKFKIDDDEIPHWTPHDLRRTVRTRMASKELGVSEVVAERVMNHALPGMAGVYNVHSYADEKREALNKWAAHLEKVIA